ncbi:MAG: zinc-ribbon domain-containing protein [Candidatus Helarchaeota archaeon]
MAMKHLNKGTLLKDMQDLARSRGGKCLSTHYVNARTKLTWQCKEGHVWKTSPTVIKKGSWCPECHGGKKLTAMHDLAARRGGKCLSTEYINSTCKLTWQCERGHVWKASSSKIKGGSWCPTCARTSPITIEDVQELARQRGGHCVSTEYVNARKPLTWNCKKGHAWNASLQNVKRGTWCPICVGKGLTIKDMQEVASQKGGRCSSTEYINAQTKLTWQCKEGHTWKATPNNVRSGHWCPKCAIKPKYSIKDMQEIARQRGGTCLSPVYINYDTKLSWQCEKGHEWETTPHVIKRGKWCPTCASTRLTIEEMQELARQRGGKCLSMDYVNNKTKLTWQCGQDHVWQATPQHVKQGSWCPTCTRKISSFSTRSKITIKDMHELARQRGGTCLSTKYKNARVKLTWQCGKGHEWEATPERVRRGIWCPACSVINKDILEEIREHASKRGGQCILIEYGLHDLTLTWKCKEGHVWQAPASAMRKDSWCPTCL